MTEFARLRIELPDHPGALAAASRVLAVHGLNVVEVSIHEVEGARAVDEIVVQAHRPLSHAELSPALAAAGAELLSIGPCDLRGDPTVTALTWVVATLEAPGRQSLATGVRLLTGIDPVHVLPVDEAARWPIALTAVRTGRPVVERLAKPPAVLRTAGDTDEGSGMWVLAAPDAPDASYVVMAARPYAMRFTATEILRLTAVLDCRRRLVEDAATSRMVWARGLASNA